MRKTVFVVIPLALVLTFSIAQAARKAARTSNASAHLPSVAIAALEKIEPEHIRAHVRFLSHDLLEGRGTGQRGGDIAAEYIATQFWLYGLKPAGDNGTYMQKVPMVGVTPQPETAFHFAPENGSPMDLKLLDDYVTNNESQAETAD